MKRRAVPTKETADEAPHSYTGLHVRSHVRELWNPYGIKSTRECTALMVCLLVSMLCFRQAVSFLATFEEHMEAQGRGPPRKGLFVLTFCFVVLLCGLLVIQDCWKDSVDTLGGDEDELSAEEEQLMRDLEAAGDDEGGDQEPDGA